MSLLQYPYITTPYMDYLLPLFLQKNVDTLSMIFQNLNPISHINKEGASHYALFVTPLMLQYI